MVRVHHKFVVIDGETDKPIVYTGSANFSGNALHHNDENLIEITHFIGLLNAGEGPKSSGPLFGKMSPRLP